MTFLCLSASSIYTLCNHHRSKYLILCNIQLITKHNKLNFKYKLENNCINKYVTKQALFHYLWNYNQTYKLTSSWHQHKSYKNKENNITYKSTFIYHSTCHSWLYHVLSTILLLLLKIGIMFSPCIHLLPILQGLVCRCR